LSQGESRKPRGKFITFEGIDGAGKSSHIEAAAAFVRAQGRRVLTTREPGGTPLGEKLRELLLHEAMHLETEALLMFAARREHLERVIEPALANAVTGSSATASAMPPLLTSAADEGLTGRNSRSSNNGCMPICSRT
jgi:putative protein kinase ArgK-like GTPase of G3E family